MHFFFGYGHKKEGKAHYFLFGKCIWMCTHVLCRWEFRDAHESAKKMIMMLLLRLLTFGPSTLPQKIFFFLLSTNAKKKKSFERRGKYTTC